MEGKADHYAHAENYCLQAMLAPHGMGIGYTRVVVTGA